MGARLPVRANLLVMFLIAGVLPCCAGEAPTVAPRPVVRAITPPGAWQPGAGHVQIPLWPGAVPDARTVDGPEITGYGKKPVAGRPWLYADRVAQPTITVYSPEQKNSGAA